MISTLIASALLGWTYADFMAPPTPEPPKPAVTLTVVHADPWQPRILGERYMPIPTQLPVSPRPEWTGVDIRGRKFKRPTDADMDAWLVWRNGEIKAGRQ